MNTKKEMHRTYKEVLKLYGWCKKISESLLACNEDTNFTEEIGRKYLKDVPILSKDDDFTLYKEIYIYREIAKSWGMKVCSGICSTKDANENIIRIMDSICFAFDKSREWYLLKIAEFCEFCREITQALRQTENEANFRDDIGKYVRDGNSPESKVFFDDEFGKIKNIIRKCCTGEMETSDAIISIERIITYIEQEELYIKSLKIE